MRNDWQLVSSPTVLKAALWVLLAAIKNLTHASNAWQILTEADWTQEELLTFRRDVTTTCLKVAIDLIKGPSPARRDSAQRWFGRGHEKMWSEK